MSISMQMTPRQTIRGLRHGRLYVNSLTVLSMDSSTGVADEGSARTSSSAVRNQYVVFMIQRVQYCTATCTRPHRDYLTGLWMPTLRLYCSDFCSWWSRSKLDSLPSVPGVCEMRSHAGALSGCDDMRPTHVLRTRNSTDLQVSSKHLDLCQQDRGEKTTLARMLVWTGHHPPVAALTALCCRTS